MAKRHDSLVLLARDHHEALLLATRLKQGKRALLRLWSHDPGFQAKFVVDFYSLHLKAHFKEEEEILFPLARTAIPSTESVIAQLIGEHRLMEQSVEQFRSRAGKNLEQDLKSFGELLERHVRTEDRTLFPMIEELATVAMLDDIQNKLQQFSKTTHKNSTP